jgi:membrane-associated phospholipid phosphatase
MGRAKVTAGNMTQLRESAAWRLFSYNWVLIGLMAVALVLALALTDFSIRLASMLVPFGAMGLYTGAAYYNAHAPHRHDPMVVFVLGSTAQIMLITLLMTPITYISAAANLPMMDANLLYLDRMLGLDWRTYFSFIYERPRLINAVVLGYSTISLPVFGIPLVLGVTRHYRRLQEFTLAFGLALIVTTIISVFVPAIGTYDQLGIKPDPAIFTPGSYLDQLRDLPALRDGSLREIDMKALAGIITFPSFHAAAAVLFLWALWGVWWMRPLALIANGAMLLATPIGGGHYFVDVFAGVAVAVISIVGVLRFSKWSAEPAQASAVGANGGFEEVPPAMLPALSANLAPE